MTNKLFPKKIMIQTTSECNALCQFCPYSKMRYSLPQGKMNDQLFLKIINECKENQNDIDTIMPYLMNEPLLDINLIEKIEIIKEAIPKAEAHILTNGFLLKDKLASKLISSKIDWIGISFFGLNKSNYEKSMGLSFETSKKRTTKFVEKAIKQRGTDFILITFFKTSNMNNFDIEEAINYWKNLGIKRISFYEKGISRAGNVKNISEINNSSMSRCDSIWTNEMLHILYNGDVILCCMDWKRQHVLGNINKNSITEIWASKEYEQARNVTCGKTPLSDTNFICKKCEMAK